MKLSRAEVNKIAIFRALQLGDILCAIPAIRAIRNAYPEAHITFIGLPGSEPLIKRFLTYFDDFIPFPGYPGLPEQGFDLEQFKLFLKNVQDHQFDLIMQMQGNGSIVNELLQTFKATRVAGFCQHLADENAFFLTYPNYSHELNRHLALTAHLGIPSADLQMEYPLSAEDKQECEQLNLGLQSGSYICIHPGSRGGWRQWPPLYFAAMGNYCTDQGFKVVLTGTKAELGIVNQVASLMKTAPLIAAGKTNLGTLGILIKDSYGLIANCTGVSHIAAALQTPSIIISMDGEPERWAPLNKEIHHTIDWTKTPEYRLVFKELVSWFFRL